MDRSTELRKVEYDESFFTNANIGWASSSRTYTGAPGWWEGIDVGQLWLPVSGGCHFFGMAIFGGRSFNPRGTSVEQVHNEHSLLLGNEHGFRYTLRLRVGSRYRKIKPFWSKHHKDQPCLYRLDSPLIDTLILRMVCAPDERLVYPYLQVKCTLLKSDSRADIMKLMDHVYELGNSFQGASPATSTTGVSSDTFVYAYSIPPLDLGLYGWPEYKVAVTEYHKRWKTEVKADRILACLIWSSVAEKLGVLITETELTELINGQYSRDEPLLLSNNLLLGSIVKAEFNREHRFRVFMSTSRMCRVKPFATIAYTYDKGLLFGSNQLLPPYQPNADKYGVQLPVSFNLSSRETSSILPSDEPPNAWARSLGKSKSHPPDSSALAHDKTASNPVDYQNLSLTGYKYFPTDPTKIPREYDTAHRKLSRSGESHNRQDITYQQNPSSDYQLSTTHQGSSDQKLSSSTEIITKPKTFGVVSPIGIAGSTSALKSKYQRPQLSQELSSNQASGNLLKYMPTGRDYVPPDTQSISADQQAMFENIISRGYTSLTGRQLHEDERLLAARTRGRSAVTPHVSQSGQQIQVSQNRTFEAVVPNLDSSYTRAYSNPATDSAHSETSNTNLRQPYNPASLLFPIPSDLARQVEPKEKYSKSLPKALSGIFITPTPWTPGKMSE